MPGIFNENEDHQDDDQGSEPLSLRDTLSANLDAAEAGTLAPVENAPELPATDAEAAARARDEQGRFAPKTAEAAPVVQEQGQPAPAPSLTTWRKEYIPLHEKLAAGIPLTSDEAKKLSEYNVQREREYSTGISTYKAEAQNSKAIQDVLIEFMPALQQNNMSPATWIQNMGRAHASLVYGSPEQKMQTFAELARSYGIPLEAVAQNAAGQLDPTVIALMNEMSELKKGYQGIHQEREQQQNAQIQQELAKFADTSKFPHFEQVRDQMAQLLESGMAGDLEAAYTKAVRLNDGLFAEHQQRQAAEAQAATQQSKAAAAVKARAAAGQVKTGTPAGKSTASPASNDLRGSLESAFDQHAGDGARV